jgi:hypothetical protein
MPSKCKWASSHRPMTVHHSGRRVECRFRGSIWKAPASASARGPAHGRNRIVRIRSLRQHSTGSNAEHDDIRPGRGFLQRWCGPLLAQSCAVAGESAALRHAARAGQAAWLRGVHGKGRLRGDPKQIPRRKRRRQPPRPKSNGGGSYAPPLKQGGRHGIGPHGPHAPGGLRRTKRPTA